MYRGKVVGGQKSFVSFRTTQNHISQALIRVRLLVINVNKLVRYVIDSRAEVEVFSSKCWLCQNAHHKQGGRGEGRSRTFI